MQLSSLECATEIVTMLKNAGFTAYFAGGWVRDYLLKHPSSDIDIATNAPPQTIVDLFPHTILVGFSFGIVVVVFKGYQFEIASFRKDLDYTDGRKPDKVELSTPLEDARRRDFTINGMFYDPLTHEIYDYIGGVEDLKKSIIRTIGDPNERFFEDRLRMIRAVRFACRFGFAIAPETQQAIKDHAALLFPSVAMERVWQELTKMNEYSNFDHALIELHRLGLLQVIFPCLQSVHLNDIKRQVATFTHFPKKTSTILHLLALFQNSSLEDVIETCQNLRISNKEIALVKLFRLCRDLVDNEHATQGINWVYFYANPSSTTLLEIDALLRPPEQKSLILENHYLRQQSLKFHIQRVIQKNPLVTSEFLLSEGISQGKLMGTLLKEAEKIAVDHDLHTLSSISPLLKKSPLWPVFPS